MHRSICLLLSVIFSLSTYSQIAFGFTNPLKSYNLYEDVHSKDNDERENIMSEAFYSQNGYNKGKENTKKQQKAAPKEPAPTADNGFNDNVNIDKINVEIPQRRNDYLRKSSQEIYAPSGTPRWEEGDTFYEEPSLDSIKQKYRASNFAGCMQECEAYVRLNPNDTLGFYYLAMCYTKADDKDNAVRAYEKVIYLNANPMIVKYATNGRNCILKSQQTEDDEDNEIKCFENVNEPEYLYPYKQVAQSIELTPVDPQELINKNLEALEAKYAPSDSTVNSKLPFANQDSELDKFIKAPYGSGLSPELEKEYKQIQLREMQENLNNTDVENSPGKYYQNIRNIKNFDKKKSESETIKLAMADENDLKDFFNSPEYIQNKKELDQIKMMFGDYKSENNNDLIQLLPSMMQGDEKLSPQALQTLMMQSVMPDIINIDGNNSF